MVPGESCAACSKTLLQGSRLTIQSSKPKKYIFPSLECSLSLPSFPISSFSGKLAWFASVHSNSNFILFPLNTQIMVCVPLRGSKSFHKEMPLGLVKGTESSWTVSAFRKDRHIKTKLIRGAWTRASGDGKVMKPSGGDSIAGTLGYALDFSRRNFVKRDEDLVGVRRWIVSRSSKRKIKKDRLKSWPTVT